MLSIQAVRGLSRLRAPGIVPHVRYILLKTNLDRVSEGEYEVYTKLSLSPGITVG